MMRILKRNPVGSWALIVAGTVLTIAVLLGGWSALNVITATNEQINRVNSQLLDQNGVLADDVDALREQVLDLGLAPVAPPAPEIPDADTIQGLQGLDGAIGLTGRQGDPGEIGATGPTGLTGLTGGGVPGANGADGANGSDGVNGADGTGYPGPTGETGATGPAGADGHPPTSWTYTDAAGFTYTCARVSEFDPAAPQYQCTTAQPGTPTPIPVTGTPTS